MELAYDLAINDRRADISKNSPDHSAKKMGRRMGGVSR